MPKPVDRSTTYVPGLDGLRTLAVAVVILFHLNVSGVEGGLLGVGVFFTLSGYLITANLMKAWQKRRDSDGRDKLGLKTFWFRRFRRLAPAMLVTVAAVLILTAALERESLGDRAGESLSTLLYVNNWHVIFGGSSYFDNFGGPGPLDHMWSLSVEEQFYVVWPLVLLVLLIAGTRLAGKKRAGTRAMTVAMWATVALAIASFVLMWALASPGFDNTRAYEGTDTRAGGLLLGAALSIWFAVRQARGLSVVPTRAASDVIGLLGVAGILAMVVFVGDQDMFLYQGGIALLSVATLMVILAVLRPDGIWSKVLGCAPMRWLGERSYGIYLWHMPVIAFMPADWLAGQPWLSGALVVAVSVGVSALSWKVLEDPIRKHGVVEPVKRWWAAQMSARRAARSTPRRTSPSVMGPYMAQTYVGSAAVVVLAAVVVVGAPSVIADAGRTGGAAPMELPQQRPAETAQDDDGADDGADGPDGGVQHDSAATGAMSCSRVIHVGDSTSIGMFDPAQLPPDRGEGSARYVDKGADDVVTSVFGARATTEGFEEYPSAVDSVSQLLAEGQPEGTCWVIATGANDAANFSVGASLNEEQRIRTMMDMLDDRKVMWVTTASALDQGPWAKANMAAFNDVLKRVATDYSDMAVYDWGEEVAPHPDWFMADDGVHYSPVGNAERADRFAAALANAFPEGEDTHPGGKVVHSGL
ncbi:MAG: acyltransferase family protein [Corynebacterium sp.]|uniref:acyltransferase family protein n=1 Tax=Corynebacterium sp. TaxID=1720 RepID=UPI003F9B4C18